MCLYPKLILNPKYKPNKKNGGKPPPIHDERIKYVPIGCQACIECCKQKARSWMVRLHEDIKTNTNGKFITLTFNTTALNEIRNRITEQCAKDGIQTMATGYDLDNQIATYATRHFLERYRKQRGVSLRHWLITELGHGKTEHIHLHGIIWTDEPLEYIEKMWNYGFMWKGKEKWNFKKQQYEYKSYVNEKTINYITKYVTKIDKDHKAYKAIILTSPGIGSNYTKQKRGDWTKNKFNDTKTNETYQTQQGYKLSLPIYYRNKIYSEKQREDLWIQKLNKNERWILGNKIDITENQDEYYRALKAAQEWNKQLGYGDGTITWERDQYERQRRKLIQEKRLQQNYDA